MFVSAAARGGVERFPKRLAKRVEREGGEKNGDAWRVHLFRRDFHIIVRAGQHRSPTGLRRLHAQTEEAERGLGKQGDRQKEGNLHNHRLDRVWHDMTRDDPPRAGAETADGIDVKFLFDDQGLRADEAGELRRKDDADRDHSICETNTQRAGDSDGEDDGGEG